MLNVKNPKKNSKRIFDVIYGFVPLTDVEWEIIHSTFYQRLKWIKQIGFSFYSFPGAEHSRFSHAIGVMHNSSAILDSIGHGVSSNYLFNSPHLDEKKKFHQTIRLAALLHDLGTFPFSHTTEMSYIEHGKKHKTNGNKKVSDDHEHLGSYIIKNSFYEGGITAILEKYQIDPQEVSYLIKGISKSVLANSILHSDIDCDRMDYLLRDAHYTGLKYGAYDRDYLLDHFVCAQVGKHDVLAIKEEAIHCVTDFLIARFAWYSQVVRSSSGAKFDALAETLTGYFLENKLIPQFSDLLEMVDKKPMDYFNFNDAYFMSKIGECLTKGLLDKNLKMKSIAMALVTGNGVRTIKTKEFKQVIISQDQDGELKKAQKKAIDKADEIENYLKKHGTKEDWVVRDFPSKNVVFTKSIKQMLKSGSKNNLLLERDPVKIMQGDGTLTLLNDMSSSFISRIQYCYNYIPHLYCPEKTMEKLVKAKFVSL